MPFATSVLIMDTVNLAMPWIAAPPDLGVSRSPMAALPVRRADPVGRRRLLPHRGEHGAGQALERACAVRMD